jgi:hypothetical protein
MLMSSDLVILIAIIAVVGTSLQGLLKLWLQRSGRSGTPQSDLKEIRVALGQIQQAIDAMAVEVERLSEGQRFTTKLLAEQTKEVGQISAPIRQG